MEKLWNESRVRADVAALGALLDDGWTVTHGDGTINTKAEYLADLKSGARKFFADVKQDDFTVRVYGDTAVAAGAQRLEGRVQGQAVRRRAALHARLREARRTVGDDRLARHAAVTGRSPERLALLIVVRCALACRCSRPATTAARVSAIRLTQNPLITVDDVAVARRQRQRPVDYPRPVVDPASARPLLRLLRPSQGAVHPARLCGRDRRAVEDLRAGRRAGQRDRVLLVRSPIRRTVRSISSTRTWHRRKSTWTRRTSVW